MKALGNLFDVIPAIVPKDLQTASDGDWVSLKNAQGVCFLVFKAAGTAGDDPAITIEQATDVAGTNGKVLNAITDYHTKQGTLTAVGAWTTTTQTADELLQGDGTSAESQALYAFSVEADQLDVANGFDCVRVRVADVGSNAQLGCALYVLYGLKNKMAPSGLPSAIVD